jgi:hypothetical protein
MKEIQENIKQNLGDILESGVKAPLKEQFKLLKIWSYMAIGALGLFVILILVGIGKLILM